MFREEFVAILRDYNSLSSISREPEPVLAQMFLIELKSEGPSIQVLSLETNLPSPAEPHGMDVQP